MDERINLIVGKDEIETKLRYLGTEIMDLFQRNAELLDRVISLENKIQSLQGMTKNE